jgi:small subunit ribosomal protein S6
MRYYETLYIINPDLPEEEYKDVLDKFNSLIENSGGMVIKVDEWGKKTLAYDVKKFNKGYYVLLQYCGEPDVLTELKRIFKLDERILKYQTIKLSNNANPEALKAKAEEGKPRAGDEEKPLEDVGENQNGQIVNSQEGGNGIQ